MSVQNVKRILLGTPIPTRARDPRAARPLTGLAIFASDALSSVAYATEEILLILMLAGSAALGLAFPIAVAIGVLIAIVVTSFRQTILAYPKGGGAYIVTRENLGRYPSLVAGAALLVDYVLTVAVSVAAGIAAITSAIRPLYPYRVTLVRPRRGVIAIGISAACASRVGSSRAHLPLPRRLPRDDRLGLRPVAPGDRCRGARPAPAAAARR